MKVYNYLKGLFKNFSSALKLTIKCIYLIHKYIKNTFEYKKGEMDFQKMRNIYLVHYGKSSNSIIDNVNDAVEIYNLYEELLKEEAEQLSEYMISENKKKFERKQKSKEIEFERKRKSKEIEFNEDIFKKDFRKILNHKRTTDLSKYGFDADEIRETVEKYNKKHVQYNKTFEKHLEDARKKEEFYNTNKEKLNNITYGKNKSSSI